MECMVRMVLFCLALAAVIGCSGSTAVDSLPAAAPTLVPPPTVTVPLSPTDIARPVPTSAPSPPAPALTPPLPGNRAADFAFKLFQGQERLGKNELRLAELEGQPVVLNFWARLCTPCWSEMPELQDFYEEYGEEVLLLGIDVGQFTGLGSPKDAGRLLSSLGVTYPAGYTDDESVVRDFSVRAMPTTVFITTEGEIFKTWTGSITRESVTAIVREMLEKE